MSRHSYIRMTKLTDVKGRIDYISNPKRQEHLYGTYTTVKPEFWELLAAQSKLDFWKSHQKKGECTEARELVIALPESFQQMDPDELLEKFSEKFRSTYGMQCMAALHHNKTKNNLHIHLIFSDREMLEKTEIKIAQRNMFYDENGRHVRTKKEIMDDEGNIREGCHILAKGRPYEIRYFAGRKEEFKSRKFLPEVKQMYTDLINELVPDKNEKQKVFDPKGPYLPTKKIGKNNPLEKEIKKDNALRGKWNDTVDQVLIAGGTQEEVVEFKTKAVTSKIAESVKENGYRPSLFAELMIKAIDVLIGFLEFLMGKEKETEESTHDVRQVKLKTEKGVTPKAAKTYTVDPEKMASAKLQYLVMKNLHDDLSKTNKKIYAITKTIERMESDLAAIPLTILNRKERKVVEAQIETERSKLAKAKDHLQALPRMKGFDSVKDAEAACRKAAGIYNTLLKKEAGQPLSKQPEKRESVLLKMARAKKLIDEQESKPKPKIEKKKDVPER